MGTDRPGRRPQIGAGALSQGASTPQSTRLEGNRRSRVVRVLPDVAAIDKEFDYLVPQAMAERVAVGTIVRIGLHGRRVGGWVVADEVTPTAGVDLKPITKVKGLGPTAEILDLARWAAWRFAGRTATFMKTASPETAVSELPAPPHRRNPPPEATDEIAREVLDTDLAVVQTPPATDTFPFIQAAVSRGNALLITPSLAEARRIATRLRRAGASVALVPRDWALAAAGATAVVGARAAAFAPVNRLAAIVVVDEHDEALQNEGSPTWNAREVAVERARRAGVPCVLLSPAPSLEAQEIAPVLRRSRAEERAGWPIVEVVDRRREDPAVGGLYSRRLVEVLRSDRRVVCVLNRKGRSRLLACRTCGSLVRCDVCDSAMALVADAVLACKRCGSERPSLCLDCGSTVLKNLRVGVTRAREELEALASELVVEVTGSSAEVGASRIHVGTEAVLHRVEQADTVAFLDFDQELLAPRYRAAEQAMNLVVLAARLVGGRHSNGRILIQTRLPRHETVLGALHADPTRVSAAERERRRVLGYPPFATIALVGGEGGQAFVQAMRPVAGIEVSSRADGCYLLRSRDRGLLLDALAGVPRPSGRLRLQIDPLRL